MFMHLSYHFFSDTYEKGMKKFKKAEFITDLNSESEDSDTKKKNRKYRAKAILSSEKESSIEKKLVRVPSYPKAPQKGNLNKQSNENAVRKPFKSY